MTYPELAAFTDECQAIDATLADIPPSAWPHAALGAWTLAELVAHLVRGAGRIHAYLGDAAAAGTAAAGGDAVATGSAEHDRISYWRFDLEAEAPAIAARARDEARDVDPNDLPARFAAAWRASAAQARQRDPDTLIPTIRGSMRLDEYTATRVVEMVVHHADVCTALALPSQSTPAAGRIAVAVCEGLLGAPKPRNLGRLRFLRIATGRIDSDDPRFPVLR